jgi:hypothetical protein
MTMQPLKAVVKNGRLLVDEPTALPGGNRDRVGAGGRLLAAIDDGIEDFERGDHIDGFDFIAQMRAKH